MKVRNIIILLFVALSCNSVAFAQKKYSSELKIDLVRKVVNDATAWQIKAYPDMDKDRYWKSYGDLSWENGVFLSALSSWAEFDNQAEFIAWYEEVADRNYWQLLGNKHRIYFADDLIVSLMYANLYKKRNNEQIIHPTVARLEFIMNNPSAAGLYRNSPNCSDRWSWADALYMAPPVFATFANLTGNYKLRDFMDREYWTAYHFLYDKQEKLFYRDSSYFGKKEKNGEKIFWGRGNGWVVAGLAMLIPELPVDYPSRERYIQLYKEMMGRIVGLQSPKGHWHASMLDPKSYKSPEMSSTGLISYALWWGINYGLLDEKTYFKPAKSAWEALVRAMQPNGMLGWVQPVGADPQSVTKDMTEVYGAGALMKTGEEIIKYLRAEKTPVSQH